VVICLELGADLHTAQLMPLPLTLSGVSKIQIGFTFLVLAHRCVCVCNQFKLTNQVKAVNPTGHKNSS